MTRFGDFRPLCSHVPSYPWCNLFFHQLQAHAPSALTGASADASSAPVGIAPECGIPRVGTRGSLSNIANIAACALSIAAAAALLWFANRRKAAVGRIELRAFLALYLLTLPLQLVTTGALLVQGSPALTILTAAHAGAVAALFWALLANALVATQVVEDGTLSSLIPFYAGTLVFLGGTTYVALDVAFTFTRALGPSSPPAALHSVPLFVLTSVWPLASALLYLALMAHIVARVLRERRPLALYALAAALFALAQLARLLLGRAVCAGTRARVDGAFVGTLLETGAVGALVGAWRSITEESWDDNAYYPS